MKVLVHELGGWGTLKKMHLIVPHARNRWCVIKKILMLFHDQKMFLKPKPSFCCLKTPKQKPHEWLKHCNVHVDVSINVDTGNAFDLKTSTLNSSMV